MINRNVLWTEKYRPTNLDSVVLPKNLHDKFTSILESGTIPNMIFSGTAGIGKTTVAKILCNTLDIDYIIINGSMRGNIDTLRFEIQNFAVTSSFKNKRKCVILDEADYLNAQSTQPALRNFMEEFSNNCAFILTCNELGKIIEPLQSRCAVVDFTYSTKDKVEMMKKFYKRSKIILTKENIEHDTKLLSEVIKYYYPDWRKVLSELQYHSSNGVLSTEILSGMQDEDFLVLIGHMKNKKYSEVRKWVGENSHVPFNVIVRKFYDNAYDLLEASTIPPMDILIAQYQHYDSMVVDKEINLAALMAELMVNVVWK